MRVMFAIYCKNKHEVLDLIRKLPQINIKTVLMINIEKNNTLQYPLRRYIINMLCEIKIQIDYMVKAITAKVNNNPIQYYFCNYLREIEN
jgi:hypothetical protein